MKKSSIILALALAVSTWAAYGQPSGDQPDQGPGGPPPDGEHHRHRPPSPLVKALDANGDGIIDAKEIANAAAALKTLDTNNDGQLTPDEFMPPRPDGETGLPPGYKEHRPPLLMVLDANGDGIIDAQEIANAPQALLKLDKNGDGKLTPDEYRPHRPPPGEGPPPGDGPGGKGPGDGNGPGPDDGGPKGPPPSQ
jgi:hypothetical protein